MPNSSNKRKTKKKLNWTNLMKKGRSVELKEPVMRRTAMPRTMSKSIERSRWLKMN